MHKYIAVTGGIGSGKSTAISIIREMGFPVFSCDVIYNEILSEPSYIEKLRKAFNGVVKNGVIDKRALSVIVFSDENARKRLEQIAHPRVMERLFEKMQDCNSNLVFAEVPLLFEGGFEKDFDDVIVILRDKEERIAAVQARDGGTRMEILQKISAQFDYDEGRKRTDLQNERIRWIENDKDEKSLRIKLQECILRLKK